MTLTIGGLFSGIGGIEYAFTAAGFQVEWLVEINPFCQQILRKHWPHARILSDVHDVGNHNLAPVDVIAGGFPCQPFSIAGSMLGEDDPRYLWPQFRRIIAELRPRVVLLENVPNLRNITHGSTFRDILRSLAEIGYDAEWEHIRAADIGAPHPRERIFVVAHTDRFRQPEPAARNAASDEERNRSLYQPTGQTEFDAPEQGRKTVANAANSGCEKNQNKSSESGEIWNRRYHDGRIDQLVNPSSTGWQESDPSRVAGDAGYAAGGFTPGQSEGLHESGLADAPDGLSIRLAGHRFPAGQGAFQYDFEPARVIEEKEPYHKDKIEAGGNAVVPQVIYPIALSIREYLEVSS